MNVFSSRARRLKGSESPGCLSYSTPRPPGLLLGLLACHLLRSLLGSGHGAGLRSHRGEKGVLAANDKNDTNSFHNDNYGNKYQPQEEEQEQQW